MHHNQLYTLLLNTTATSALTAAVCSGDWVVSFALQLEQPLPQDSFDFAPDVTVHALRLNWVRDPCSCKFG